MQQQIETARCADRMTSDAVKVSGQMMQVEAAAAFIGVSKSTLYKLTMRKAIPYYKPFGKILYFNRDELTVWLQQNRVATFDESERAAMTYCATH